MKIALIITGLLVVPNAAVYAVAAVPTAESSTIWDNTVAVLTMAVTAIGVMVKLMFAGLKLIQSAQTAIDGIHAALEASRRRDEDTMRLREKQLADFMLEVAKMRDKEEPSK